VKRLHLLLAASAAAVRDCAGQLGPGDQVLLADRGIGLLADAPQLRRLQAQCRTPVCGLQVDAAAHGLQELAGILDVMLIGDRTWVEWVAEHPVVLSWK